jgi:hypothetical protein
MAAKVEKMEKNPMRLAEVTEREGATKSRNYVIYRKRIILGDFELYLAF